MSPSLDRITTGIIVEGESVGRGTGCANARTSGSVGAVCLMYRLQVQDERRTGRLVGNVCLMNRDRLVGHLYLGSTLMEIA